jgi:hypothetical protein
LIDTSCINQTYFLIGKPNNVLKGELILLPQRSVWYVSAYIKIDYNTSSPPTYIGLCVVNYTYSDGSPAFNIWNPKTINDDEWYNLDQGID